MARKWKQPTLFNLPLAKHIVMVKTSDLDVTTNEGGKVLMERMAAVPLDKSILLEFLLGRKKGDPHQSEEHAEWHRLQALMNSRVRGKRWDFFGPGLIPTMVRKSIREKSWIPKGLTIVPNEVK